MSKKTTQDTHEEPPIRQTRQWVTLRQGSLDARLGTGQLLKVPHELKTAAGQAGKALLAYGPSVAKDVVRACKKELTHEGFYVHELVLLEGAKACSLDESERIMKLFQKEGFTSDDVCLALGDGPSLSSVQFACSHWQQGMPLAVAPTNMEAAIADCIAPSALSFKKTAHVLSHACGAKICVVDPLLIEPVFTQETLFAYVRMALLAISDDEKSFGRLWDRTKALVEADPATVYEQLADSMRSRGRVVSSTSIAVRQSQDFGVELMDVMRTLVGDGPSDAELLADITRFLVRLAVAEKDLSLDDMYAVDEFFEMLGISEIRCTCKGKEMARALRGDCFKRRRRFMLLIPHALGRVRLTPISEELLIEHASAWCKARA